MCGVVMRLDSGVDVWEVQCLLKAGHEDPHRGVFIWFDQGEET